MGGAGGCLLAVLVSCLVCVAPSGRQVSWCWGGQVEEVYIMKDKAAGQSKGCAFVRFASTDAANAAIQGLHQKITMPGATQALIAAS